MCVCAVVPLAARIHARDSRRRCPDGRFEEEGRALTADKSTEHFFFFVRVERRRETFRQTSQRSLGAQCFARKRRGRETGRAGP